MAGGTINVTCATASPGQKAFDFSAYIGDRTKDFTGREWLFEQIDSWLADPKGPPFCLISGPPGSGKSAFAGRLVQVHCNLTAHHFCIARDAATIDPTLFVRSLAKQLCSIEGFATKILGTHIHVSAATEVRENYGEVVGLKIENLIVAAPSAVVAFVHTVLTPMREDRKSVV